MKKVQKRLSVFLILLMMLTFNNWSMVFASTVQKDGDAPVSTGGFTPVHDGEYVEATNSYDDGDPTYYLATHDPFKAGLTEITYNGVVYPLAGVALVSEDFNYHTQTASDGARIFAYDGPSNITIFFDDGRYNDTVATNYTAFSRTNNSYIGLNKDGNGESMVTISRNPRFIILFGNLMERYLLNNKNLYFENLKFDGKNIDMVPVDLLGARNRGEALIFISGGHNRGADGLVMRDIVIENVGDTNHDNNGFILLPDTLRKNVAINIIFNPGQVNLENITIRNVRTDGGFGVVSVQDSSDSYLRNISIDMSEVRPDYVFIFYNIYVSPVKVETTQGNIGEGPALDYPDHKTVIESLTTTNVANPENDTIYVQDYRYHYVSVPSDYRYAVWNMSNGDYFTPVFDACKELRPATAGKAIQDINDGYWVVDANSAVSIEQQLEDILTVMGYTENGGNPKAPRANIKLFSDTAIPGFTVPDGYAGMDVNIVAVPTADTLYSSKVLVPTVDNVVIILPADTNVKLYNFDFFENAQYTMYEAIAGITPLATLMDPADKANGTYDFPGYPNYADYAPAAAVDPKVINSNSNTFVNCKFVVLASEIEITNIPVELVVGRTHDLDHEFTGSSTLNEDLTLPAEIDDTEVMWVSSDETIATINADGVVTPLADGEVTFFLKALDSYNNGEIEKPFASVKLTVVTRFNLTTSVDGGNGTVSPGKTDVLKGTTETVTFTPDEGYEIDKVTVNGVEVAVVGNTLTLVMDENKDVVVSYKKMPITTRWVDEDNNDLKAPVTALEAQPAGTIEGYSFVETITEGTNVTHCFEKIVIPDTGDNYPIQLLISIAMVSLAGVVIVSKRKKSYGMKA